MRYLLRLTLLCAAPWLLAPVLSAETEAGSAVAGTKEIVGKFFSSVAINEGDVGSGTGFIVKEGATTRLYTAAHVIAGNRKLTVKNADGRQFAKFVPGEFCGYHRKQAEQEKVWRAEAIKQIQSAAARMR